MLDELKEFVKVKEAEEATHFDKLKRFLRTHVSWKLILLFVFLMLFIVSIISFAHVEFINNPQRQAQLVMEGKNPYFEASLGYPPEAHAGHIRFFTKKLLLSYLEYKGFETIEFTSDVVNFTPSGKIASKLFADLFPTFGRSLIVKALQSNKKSK